MRLGPLLLGIDAGTGGLRGIATTSAGRVLTEARCLWENDSVQPSRWWDAFVSVTQSILRDLGTNISRLCGMAVVSTSGTLICADCNGRALAPAIMYHDPRAHLEAAALVAAGHAVPYRFSASFSLPKARWIQQHQPQLFGHTARLCHAADWFLGRLTDEFVSDYSNALKMGYDLNREVWPSWIDSAILERLPRVVAPGTVVGSVTQRAGAATGLPPGLPVVAGATDGVAGVIASGLQHPGDYSTTLGTTLIFKGLSRTAVHGPNLYSHKLPGGLWLPGGASNTGAAWTREWFSRQDLSELDRKAFCLLPTRCISYPLVGKGERFPFSSRTVTGFANPARGLLARYASCLQGTAFVERLAYETLDRATGAAGGDVYATGGASLSDAWMQCRADVCQRVLHRVASPEAAMGAAILAAAGTTFDSLAAAMAAMTRVERSFEPNPGINYDDEFARFVDMLPI